MRISIVILLFISLLAQTFSKGWVFTQFFLHQDYIAAHLCENRERPELACKGHCYLNKELEKDAQKEKHTFVKEKYEITLFTPISCFQYPELSFFTPIKICTPYLMGMLSDYHPSFFHPPGFYS